MNFAGVELPRPTSSHHARARPQQKLGLPRKATAQRTFGDFNITPTLAAALDLVLAFDEGEAARLQHAGGFLQASTVQRNDILVPKAFGGFVIGVLPIGELMRAGSMNQ
jgi:hypothetical protein